MKITTDIICQVYAGKKSKKTIDLVLKTFLPLYKSLNLDYTSKPDDIDYVFQTEDEMINYFIENSRIEQTFYWNQHQHNPNRIMIGANITSDDKLIMSLTVETNEEKGQIYFDSLKEILNSNIGVISYIDPVEYENGEDFVLKYGKK